MTALDEACRALRELAQAEGLNVITVDVMQDGRVEFTASRDGYNTCWTVRADLDEPGIDGPLPSAALAMRGPT